MNQVEVKDWNFIKDFRTDEGTFFLYDRGIGFRAGRKPVDDYTEYFSFSEDDKSFKEIQNHYICIKNNYVDYKVVIVDEEIFFLFLYPNNVIKPLRISGCMCGDITVSKIRRENFHFSCGHSIINSRKTEVIKEFNKKVDTYDFKSFSRY